jgi:hypothetical protein
LAEFHATAEGVLELLALVASDPRLAGRLRERIQRLNPVAVRTPALALERLDAIAAEYAPRFGRSNPAGDLARCVGTEVFWMHHLDKDIKAFFTDPASYRLQVERAADRPAKLTSDLSGSAILFPQAHSWMAYSAEIAGLSGSETRQVLAIDASPPLVTFQLPQRQLTASGVTVREPCGLDAVPERHLDWRPGGPRSGYHEVVDGDVPRSALGGIEWRT